MEWREQATQACAANGKMPWPNFHWLMAKEESFCDNVQRQVPRDGCHLQ
jgi:hypothetical protein